MNESSISSVAPYISEVAESMNFAVGGVCEFTEILTRNSMNLDGRIYIMNHLQAKMEMLQAVVTHVQEQIKLEAQLTYAKNIAARLGYDNLSGEDALLVMRDKGYEWDSNDVYWKDNGRVITKQLISKE